MNSIVCTLYEGNYHYGVSALINSLYKNSFRGIFIVGYRGDLPEWTKGRLTRSTLDWENGTSFEPAADFVVHFLPIKGNIHFTNYKPNFLLQLWEIHTKNNSNVPGIFYFDPDIVNKCNWEYYENWIKNGIAVVHEIVWNDMPPTHPKRFQWRAVSDCAGFDVKNHFYSYVNAGFIGLGKEHIGFAKLWQHLIMVATQQFDYDLSKFSQSLYDHNLFKVGDQDLMNLALMCSDFPVCEVGPEGMDFTGGGWLMSHATGAPKPWNVNFFTEWLKGKPPSLATKEYWKNAKGIIYPYSRSFLKRKMITQKVVSILSRFYSK